ncbi:MAG: molecular chaperone TorD family protein [Anaerolineae bacterium]|nr:molecular chaperone TorD family protein [Anaerolineae bacterium]
MSKDSTSMLFDAFAELLEYPSAQTKEKAQGFLEQVQVPPEAAEELEKFARAIGQISLDRMQEVFTITFDMQPVCYPYVGYHLFGESYKRGAFMAQLNEAYHAIGYSAGLELPDHLAVILRFIGLDSNNSEGEFCQALLGSGVSPALEKMLKVFGAETENPYFWLLSALHQLLVGAHEKELTHA